MSVSDFGAFYGSIAPISVAPVPVPTLEQTNTAEIQPGGTNPFSVTLPGGYSTALNDCIIVGLCLAGTVTVTVSGCGATWVIIQTGSAPTTAVAVGYGASAGGTSISIGGTTTTSGDIVISVWSNVASVSDPVTAQESADSGAGTVTTSSLSYSGNQLVLGIGGCGSGSGSVTLKTPTWSNGVSNTLVFQSANGTSSSRPCRMDYQLPSSSGSTTLTETLSSGTQGTSAIALALNHA